MKLAVKVRAGAAIALAMAFAVMPGTASAQAAKLIPLILNIGAWIAEKVGDHYADKTLDAADEALAEKYKARLGEAKTSLEDKKSPSPLDRATLESVSNQISILNALLAKQGTDNSERAAIELQLHSDLSAVNAALSKQDQRLDALQSIVEKLQLSLARTSTESRPPAPAEPSPPPNVLPNLLSDSGVRPSFDCAKAKTFVEHEICANARLSSSDAELGRLYWDARRRLAAPESANLRLEQLAWLRQRNYLLTSVCVGADQHLDTDYAIFFWNERIAELRRE